MLVVAFTNGMTVSQIQRYIEFKKRTESIFAIALSRKILKTWALIPSKVVKLMDKRKINIMSKIFLYLRMKVMKKKIIKGKIFNNVQKKNIANKRVSVVLTHRK